MILEDFILSSRANQSGSGVPGWEYSGIDVSDPDYKSGHWAGCADDYINSKTFKEYPYKIHYTFNSRGYRDSEWPDSFEELSNSIWCLGDSFTVGLGSPYEHIWPQRLQKRLGKRTINVSMDGASNDWILRRTKRIVEEINPKFIVIMWSYFNRRESPNEDLSDEDRRLHWLDNPQITDLDDYLHWKTRVSEMKELSDNIIQLCIPMERPGIRRNTPWTDSQDGVIPVKLLDYGRDNHHFDIKTSEWVVDQIQPLFL